MRSSALAFATVLGVACSSSSGGGGSADGGDAGTTPTGPTFTLSPTCGRAGDTIGMKLAKDNVAPRCVATTDFAVEFPGAGVTQPSKAGLSSDGFCEIDVAIPAGSQSGTVVVKTGGDTFVSAAPLSVPCP